MKQVPWNKYLLEEFIEIGGLTEEEIEVITTRVKGWSTEKQALELGMSISKVNTIIRRLKVKYDYCQKFSEILPPRMAGAKETYKKRVK